MPLIVDANNVLETTGALPPHLAGPDLAELAGLIAASRFGGEAVVLVCDGPAREAGPLPPGIRAIFAGARAPRQSADAVIASMVSASTHPRRLLVISSDRAVLAQARRRRCRVMDSPRFLETLAIDADRQDRPAAGGAKPDAPPEAPGFPPDIIRDAERLLGDADL